MISVGGVATVEYSRDLFVDGGALERIACVGGRSSLRWGKVVFGLFSGCNFWWGGSELAKSLPRCRLKAGVNERWFPWPSLRSSYFSFISSL